MGKIVKKTKDSDISLAPRLNSAQKQNNEALNVDLSIFQRRDLGVLEALIKHLHEVQKFGLSEIATALNRDIKTIWTSYHAALRKTRQIEAKEQGISVPIEIFCNRELGVLEALSAYLARLGFDHNRISEAITRHPKTVYTVLRRARIKGAELSRIEEESEPVSESKPEVGPQVPVSLFASREIGILEALSEYLSTNEELTNKEIAKLLRRSPKTVWSSIAKAKEKKATQTEVKKQDSETSEILVPATIFSKRRGVLEVLCEYLEREHGLGYSDIAKLLSRDRRTIWSALKRSKDHNKDRDNNSDRPEPRRVGP